MCPFETQVSNAVAICYASVNLLPRSANENICIIRWELSIVPLIYVSGNEIMKGRTFLDVGSRPCQLCVGLALRRRGRMASEGSTKQTKL